MLSLKKIRRVSGIAFIWLWVFSLPGYTQIQSIAVKVDGLSCPFCSYGLSKELKKVEGVKDAKVFVDAGRVELEVETGKAVEIEKLPGVVRNGGFTAREITITAVGQVKEWNGRPVLAVTPGDSEFLLEKGENLVRLQESLAAQGKKRLVTISGKIKKQNPKSHHGHPLTLQIERFELK